MADQRNERIVATTNPNVFEVRDGCNNVTAKLPQPISDPDLPHGPHVADMRLMTLIEKINSALADYPALASLTGAQEQAIIGLVLEQRALEVERARSIALNYRTWTRLGAWTRLESRAAELRAMKGG